MDAKYKRTRFNLQTAKGLLTEASRILQNAYMMDEFQPGSRLDNRIFSLHKEAWEIREKIVKLNDVLFSEDNPPAEGYSEEVQRKRYELGLMSEDEEREYVWSEKQKNPF